MAQRAGCRRHDPHDDRGGNAGKLLEYFQTDPARSADLAPRREPFRFDAAGYAPARPAPPEVSLDCLPGVSFLGEQRQRALKQLEEAKDPQVKVLNGFLHLPSEYSDPYLRENMASCPPKLSSLEPPAPSSQPPAARTTVLVRNVPSRANADKLREFAQDLGFQPMAVKVPLDRFSGCAKGYCFLRFQTERLAEHFIELCEGRQLANSPSQKRLTADFAKKELEPDAPKHRH